MISLPSPPPPLFLCLLHPSPPASLPFTHLTALAVICTVRGCIQCSQDGQICLSCRNGLVLNAFQNTCDLSTINQLDDVAIIGKTIFITCRGTTNAAFFFLVAIIVGSIVAAILVVCITACFMSWAYHLGERPRMKRKAKKTDK